ncbi:aldose 1-epimerase [Nocardia sp. NPDC020380]|uniref:aldose epimerase family protein n=1 Tax=Nocardia sp. NPDC020380 TaxID=3364309 RepID=UPI003799ABC4
MSDTTIELAAGDARLSIDTGTGRITSFRVAGSDVLTPGPKNGAFPMAPWCGRMRNGILAWDGKQYEFPRNAEPHAMHGTVRGHPWEVAERSGTRIVLTQKLQERWPFPGTITQSIELAADAAAFRMTIEAHAEPFPAQVGWHPWFAKRLATGGAAQLDFHPGWQEERGPDYLPDGNRITPLPGPWDDCFGMPDGIHATLTWPGAFELTVSSPLRWIVVFDQPADSICVEPMSGPPNGLNTMPYTVTPEAPLQAEMNWQWRDLSAGAPQA